MKLKKEYDKFKALIRDGLLFDPENRTFFDKNPKTFNRPKEFEEWKIQKLDPNSYLKDRLKELGMTEKNNKIELVGGLNLGKNERADHKIMYANKRGDIGIMQWSLDRVPYTYSEKDPESTSSINREHYHEQVRLAPWNEHIFAGKYDFSKAKNIPFFPPGLIDEFEAEEKQSDMLIITEGQIKALKADHEGLPVVGLTSITHYKNKNTGTIHSDIVRYIKECNIKRLVILWDGDCTNISDKALAKTEDISKRPFQFYNFAAKIRELVQEFLPAKELDVFFATIKSYDIDDGKSKGIDDLLINHSKNTDEIVSDFKNIGNLPGTYIHWINITKDQGLKKLFRFFNLTSDTVFYQAHKDKIQARDFIFNGTTYKVEDDKPIIKVSASLKQYKRIGTEYYRMVDRPFPLGKGRGRILEETLVPWKSAAILLDHGKVLDHIEKYIGFTNEAEHVNYQQVIDGHWNLYQNIDHKSEQGDFKHIELLLKHLFQDQYTMILDYITLLYRNPFQKLPIPCLVSAEQKTGKSTFGYLMKLIFKQNMVGISGTDLLNEFNSHWITKLIVYSEETMLEKKESYEKIKDISTKKTFLYHEKNKVPVEIPCMAHFIFMSNHQDDFIKINDTDTRLWIIKVKSIEKKIKGFDNLIADEIPQFIDFIQNRDVEYEDDGERLYFHEKDFQTDAFRNVVKHSEPGIIKEIREHLTEWFMMTGVQTISMAAKDIKAEFGINKELHYLSKEITRFLKPERPLDSAGNVTSSTYSYMTPSNDPNDPNKMLTRKGKGRYFIFDRKMFCEDQGNPVQQAMNLINN